MSTIMQRAHDARQNAAAQGQAYLNHGQAALDARYPPKLRNQHIGSLRAYVSQHPRLSLFLAANLALSGPPITVFLLFSAFTLITSLATFLIGALVAALCVVGFCVGTALLLLVPVVFVTSTIAISIFLWSVVSFWVLQRIVESDTPLPYAKTIVERIQSLGDESAGQGGKWSREFNGEKRINGVREDGTKPDIFSGLKEVKAEDDDAIKSGQKEKKDESISIDGPGATL